MKTDKPFRFFLDKYLGVWQFMYNFAKIGLAIRSKSKVNE